MKGSSWPEKSEAYEHAACINIIYAAVKWLLTCNNLAKILSMWNFHLQNVVFFRSWPHGPYFYIRCNSTHITLAFTFILWFGWLHSEYET